MHIHANGRIHNDNLSEYYNQLDSKLILSLLCSNKYFLPMKRQNDLYVIIPGDHKFVVADYSMRKLDDSKSGWGWSGLYQQEVRISHTPTKNDLTESLPYCGLF